MIANREDESPAPSELRDETASISVHVYVEDAELHMTPPSSDDDDDDYDDYYDYYDYYDD